MSTLIIVTIIIIIITLLLPLSVAVIQTVSHITNTMISLEIEDIVGRRLLDNKHVLAIADRELDEDAAQTQQSPGHALPLRASLQARVQQKLLRLQTITGKIARFKVHCCC